MVTGHPEGPEMLPPALPQRPWHLDDFLIPVSSGLALVLFYPFWSLVVLPFLVSWWLGTRLTSLFPPYWGIYIACSALLVGTWVLFLKSREPNSKGQLAVQESRHTEDGVDTAEHSEKGTSDLPGLRCSPGSAKCGLWGLGQVTVLLRLILSTLKCLRLRIAGRSKNDLCKQLG